MIWTVGVKASPLTAQVEGERDGLGRLRVDDHLKVIGQAHIYATGDVAWAAVDEIGNHALMTCQHAIPMGRHWATTPWPTCWDWSRWCTASPST